MKVERIHHVAYRCMDSKVTADFYERMLGMKLLGAAAEERVPSTKEVDPYMNIFLDAGDGDILAFFEVPRHSPMERDPNTPAWLQHIAFEVKDLEALEEAKRRLQEVGTDVVGPIDHTIFKSIYFFDPNGHRLELAAWTESPASILRLRKTAQEMLDEWSRTKQPPRQAAWVHRDEFATARQT